MSTRPTFIPETSGELTRMVGYEQIEDALGVSRSSIERAVKTGALPAPGSSARGPFGLPRKSMAGLNIVLKLRLHEGNSVPHTRRQLRRMFASLPRDLAGLDFSIAGIDVSANEHSDDGFRPHYQTQLYGFSTKRQWALVDAALRERYRQPGVVHAPVQKKSFDGNPAEFVYAIKGVRGKQTYQANQAA